MCGVWYVELDEDDMALMAEATGAEVKTKTEAVKKESKKEEEPLPDYDAVVAADVDGRCAVQSVYTLCHIVSSLYIHSVTMLAVCVYTLSQC